MAKRILSTAFVLLVAPVVMYGLQAPDETQALMAAQEKSANEAIEGIFDELYERPSDDTFALLGCASTVVAGAAGAGTAVTLRTIMERPSIRFFDPLTAGAVSSIGLQLFNSVPAAVTTIAALVAGYKVYGVFKAGILSPLERKFDKLLQENNKFKKAFEEHQKEYETLTDELISKKLEKAEKDIKALLADWFKQIDATNSEVLGNLSEQEKKLQKLRAQVSSSYHGAFDEIIEDNSRSREKLNSMHAISPETLEKYAKKHEKGPLARFFGGIGKVFYTKK